MTVATDGLGSPGTIYRLRTRAINIDNVASEWSEVLVVALGAVPTSPSIPYKDDSASGANQIAVKWPALTGESLPTYGYLLYCDLTSDHNFTLIQNGTYRPELREYVFDNIENYN